MYGHNVVVAALGLLFTAVSPAILAAEATTSYPVGGACSGALACTSQDFTVSTGGVLRAQVAVTFTCLTTTVHLSVDGSASVDSAPVAAGGSTGIVDLGPVAPGTHTLTVAADVPLSIDCDSHSWSGTLSVTTSGVSNDDVAYVAPGGTDTVSTPGITATLDRRNVSTTAAIARLSVAMYDGLPSGLPSDPYAPSDPFTPAAAFLDLQLTNATHEDVIAGEFYPVDPIYPVDPVFPTDPTFPNDPVLPPNPVRLAYWTGDAWAPVYSAGGGLPGYDIDLHKFTVTFDATSTPQVTELGGTVFSLVTGYYFRGFAIPVDAGVMNVAKAGRAIPLKWQVFDYAVEPVTDLRPAIVKLWSVPMSCTASTGSSDAIEEYAAGASGLQNLGDGIYQLNWATSKSYAGTCRRVLLDLGERNPDGTPFYRTADFQFTR